MPKDWSFMSCLLTFLTHPLACQKGPLNCINLSWATCYVYSSRQQPASRSKNLNSESITFLFGEGNGTPLQYSCLENPMDGGAWWAAVHGVAKNRTRLSNFTFTFHFYALEKEMATHSSVLAWRIPGMGEPGGLPSMGSHRVGHNWSDLAAAALRWPDVFQILLEQTIISNSWKIIACMFSLPAVAFCLFCEYSPKSVQLEK